MLWPDVTKHIKETIVTAIQASGYAGTPVYLGASSAVPNNDGVYVIPSNRTVENSTCARESMTVYVEVWAKAQAPETGDDDVAYENDHVFASWDKLAKLSHLLADLTFNGGYTADHKETTGDGGAFHPIAGCRLQFNVTYGVSDDG